MDIMGKRTKRSKSRLLMVIIGLILCVSIATNAVSHMGAKETVVYCNEQKITLEVVPEKVGEVYLLPYKEILKQANMTVTELNGRIQATNGKKSVAVNYMTGKAMINSRIITLPEQTKKVNDELMIPTSFIEEACLFKVETDAEQNMIKLLPRVTVVKDVNGKKVYEGDISNEGKRNGYGQEYDPASGQLMYAGDWNNDVKQGQGTFTWKNKNTYTGKISQGEANGQGSLIFYGVGTYTGNFVNGKRSGTGTFTWNDGDKYTGSWSNDKMNGTGTYTFSNGSYYTGTWMNNKITKITKKGTK